MKLFRSRRPTLDPGPGVPATASDAVCLQCGMVAGPGVTFCRRCGLPIGDPPRWDASLPACPICYQSVGDDGRIESFEPMRGRVDLVAHLTEHDRHPVGDDDYLESLRAGD